MRKVRQVKRIKQGWGKVRTKPSDRRKPWKRLKEKTHREKYYVPKPIGYDGFLTGNEDLESHC